MFPVKPDVGVVARLACVKATIVFVERLNGGKKDMWKMTWIQLMNRWRSNVWVCVELLLAFCLAWYMVDYFFVEIYNRSLPSGRDYTNVWQVEMGLLPETSPDYRAAESDSIAHAGKL